MNEDQSLVSTRRRFGMPARLSGHIRGMVGILATALFVQFAGGAVVFDNGAPNLNGGSEMTHWLDADKFKLSANTILWQVRFWDAEASASFQGSVFWEICSDSGNNTPGAVLFSGLSTAVTHSATGSAVFGIYPEFVDNAALPSVLLFAGSYWLVLHNGPLSNNTGRDIFWEAANNSSTLPSLSDVAPFVGNWLSNGASSQLAFQLYGVPSTFGPTITAIDYNHGSPRISFRTTSGQQYLVEFTSTLVNPMWNSVSGATNVSGTGGVVQVTDPGLAGATKRFYRVSLLPMFTTQ